MSSSSGVRGWVGSREAEALNFNSMECIRHGCIGTFLAYPSVLYLYAMIMITEMRMHSDGLKLISLEAPECACVVHGLANIIMKQSKPKDPTYNFALIVYKILFFQNMSEMRFGYSKGKYFA